MGIFDQIKNAFGNKAEPEPDQADDEAREIEGADSSAMIAAKTVPTAVTADAPADPGTYTVKSGDTLWTISEQVYGDGSRYMDIFNANSDTLESPDQIFPGQGLIIP